MLLTMFVLLIGAVSIYSLARSNLRTTQARPSHNGYDEAGHTCFYEVVRDDSTPAPDTTMSGQLLLQLSCPAWFAIDPAALNRVEESIIS